MSKRRNYQHRQKRQKHAPPGTAPGVMTIPDDALKLQVRTFHYDQQSLTEKEITTVSEIREQIQKYPEQVHWFDVKGFGDKLFLEELADYFGILRLQMEDVVNVYQRPKLEECTGYIFLISRVLQMKEGHLCNNQMSIVLGKNYVITFQDGYDDVLDPVRERIHHGRGYMRRSGADYLMYTLMDVVVDNYYPILEKIGERLDEL